MTPERRHLRRLRWRATVLFALTTTMCLVVLAVMASVIDTRSHTRETFRELTAIATQLAHSAETSTDGLHFNSQSVQAWTAVRGTFAYVDPDGIVVASPDQAALPASRTLSTLTARALRTDGPVRLDAAPGGDTRSVHWVALAVPYSDTVALAGISAEPPPEHGRLDLLLLLSVLALATIGSGLGHLLSGLAMRPAIRGIEQHEQFLREAAHELRTPLAVMRLSIGDAPAPALLPLAAQVDRMTGLVTRLLERARLRSTDREDVVLEPTRLDQVVELAVEDLAGAGDVGLDLSPTVVVGHSDLLAQAVRNLVENALRHGAAPVVVRVRDHTLSVEDAGTGIPERERRRVLRGGRTSLPGTGTGTGLSIVRWVAHLHRARLALRGSDRGGLLVELVFPRDPAAAPEHARRPA